MEESPEKNVCVCNQMNRTEKIKQIIQQLLNQKLGYYSKRDIEKAILEVCGIDPRTQVNWFNYIWKLEYITQPEPGIYHLNVTKCVELEVSIPPQIDTKQMKLGVFRGV